MTFEIAATPEAAIDRLERLYSTAREGLRHDLMRFFETGRPPGAEERERYRYPLLRVTWRPDQRSFVRTQRGYAKFAVTGVHQTTVTQPAEFRTYLLDQLRPLAEDYGAIIETGPSTQQIPYPYALDGGDELGRGDVTASELARYFPTPLLSLVGDEIADGTFELVEGEPRPLALFDAVRTDFSLRRLVHYTGTDWRAFQPWILLTNYHRYVDQFVRLGLAEIAGGTAEALVTPGGVRIDRAGLDETAFERVMSAPWHRFQMPAYHLLRANGAGVTLVNIGVGPSNAKTITDHLAVLRPHCWLMVGHCGGLRQTQIIGDYVLAHAYLRQDGILDELVPPDIPIPALAEVQVALQQAAGDVTGEQGDQLKRRLRTGTVVTQDDRNWELRWTQERRRINLSRAIAVDMESGTIAAQGYRLRVPYGTLLCVSDKPLHGEIKLPGAANAFYERAVSEHLKIGLAALDRLKETGATIHSRKLRSFDEPPFR
ncbi:AMP nucleosidase [Ancylobacter sp. 6x-1]|uniref:AMP nucleosidase n=1 Tax=Ancylobacter crimeensis TaxID=2579147 RepID=A0ABT0DFH0_9HYPH|nr:AMP nucleosidase [Ancylobacter crimeensis]MCK0198624.1 AMP nucleosidase [Ancylobacter crimeensis]